MIKQERVHIGSHYYTRTYSDEGYRIKQQETGLIYDEAIDLLSVNYTYVETDEKIPEPEEPEDIVDEPVEEAAE